MSPCPSKVRDRIRPTTWGWLWLIVVFGFAGVGLYKNINLILLIAYFMAALVLLNWWRVRRSLRGLSISGIESTGTFAGEWGRVGFEIRNQKRTTNPGVTVSIRIADAEVSHQLDQLNRDQSGVFSKSYLPRVRNCYDSIRFEIADGYPFGLIESRRTIDVTLQTAIYPRLGRLRSELLTRRLVPVPAVRGQRRAAVRQLVEGTDIHGLRPFRPGDSPRWIHWRTTARVGAPMVREFDRATGPRLFVILEPSGLSNIEMEAALSALATTARDWTHLHDGGMTAFLPTRSGWNRYEVSGHRSLTSFLTTLAGWPRGSGSRPPAELPNVPRSAPKLHIGREPAMMHRMAIWLDPTVDGDLFNPPVDVT